MPLPSLWLKGEMEGNPAGVFTCTASTHGGQQTTLVTMMIPLPHLGTLIVGVPYSVEGMLHTEATPHGATTIAGGQGELEPRPENLVIARKQLRLNLTPPRQISTLPAVLVNLEPRPNAARTFLAALKDDWKLPVKRKRVLTPKPQPPREERPPEISDEELAKMREESRAMFDQLRKSLRAAGVKP
jgi:hypothetical protein